MAYPAKKFYAAGYTTKPEGSYGGGGSLSVATDGVQLALADGRAIPMAYKEGYDGVRSYDLAARSPLPILAPGARYIDGVELPFSFKGYGSAYSASNKVNIHNLMLAAGWEAAGSFGAGTEKWTWTPWSGSASPTSLVANIYTGAEKWPILACFTAYRWVCELGKPGMDFFKHWALLGDPVDDLGGAEALTIVYPNLAIDPPKSDGMVFAIGSFVLPDVQKCEFDSGWEDPSPRQLVSAAGAWAGWARGITMAPRLKITLEKTALVGSPFHTSAGLDPYNLRKAATKLTGSTVSVQRGTQQYNRRKTIFTQAQLVDVVEQDQNGSVSMVTLTFGPYSSTPTANDAVSIVDD